MLGDLAEQMRKAGSLKLLDSVSSQALAYLERLPPSNMGTRELASHARALRTVGEVLVDRGDFDTAKGVFQRAHDVSVQGLRDDPKADEPLAERGLSSYWLGYLTYRQKQYDQALSHWNDYLDATTELLARTPGDPSRQLEMSYALNNLGTLARARLDDALATDLFTRSIDLKRRVLAARPQDTSVQYELVDSLSWLSSVFDSQGRLADAETGYREQIAMLRQLVANEDDADAWRRRLATSLLRSFTLALAQGRLTSAAADAEESRQLLTFLVEKQPDNAVWRRDLAHAYAQAGWVALLRGELAHSHTALIRAQALLAPLLEKQPPPEWESLAATIQLRILQLEAVAKPHTRPTADDLIANLEELHTRQPNDLLGLSLLATALIWRGERLQALQAGEAARADWSRAALLLDDAAPRTHDRTLLDPWIRAQIHLGHRQQVAAQLEWLRNAGYRHPSFIDVYNSPSKEILAP
jgi:tetratricopeptide (TPR) repeat protein